MRSRPRHTLALDEGSVRQHTLLMPKVNHADDVIGRANRCGVNFLKLEVRMALTFTALATSTHDPDRRARCLRSARRAYEAVKRLMGRMALSDPEKDFLISRLQDLQSKLSIEASQSSSTK